ncbi:helix-turn-helix domain-containing protein [Candidatus Latescibacterota bacterium]
MQNSTQHTPTYLTEVQVSEITGFALSTLRNKRFNRVGINYSKIGRSVRYSLDDVIAYMENHKINLKLDNGDLRKYQKEDNS